ncbi:hypothetical protein ERJ75_000102300 [Trypanosoma vivax]|nr:hypothetical protein ERJ75_000102300 [Trypanosoma vivax]
MHTVEVGTARAHEQLNNASLSASREKRSVTCKLVAQLRGVQTDLVSLRKEALGLANDTSEAHVSQSPVMQMSGAEQSVADGVAVVAAGVLKDIEENLDFIKHSVNSPAKEVNIHPVNFSECTDKRGSITKDSVMGAVVQYFQLVGSNSTSHTKEALRKALNRWLRLRKASAKLVPRVVSVPLHESDAHGKASEVHKNTVYFEDVDRSPKRSETSHDGNETSTDVMGGVPFQAPKSSSTLMWLVMLISPLLLLVVLLSVILLRYRTQKKLDTQKNVKFPSIAHSRAGSFERFSYVPSEAENDSFAKMSEIELNMAPTW